MEKVKCETKKPKNVVLGGRQQRRGASPEPLSRLARILRILNRVRKFQEFIKLNGNSRGIAADVKEIERYRGEFFTTLAVPVQQFQGDGMEVHHVRWTANQGFRKTGDVRADWV